MNWEKQIAAVSPRVVKISTPTGWGTGFLAFYNFDKSWCGIATAAHVVGHADEWQQPIRITHAASGTSEFYSTDGRVIIIDHATDSAVVFCLKRQLGLPDIPVALLPVGEACGLGSELGWLGYPSIEPNTLCFFTGAISAKLDHLNAYLIDGVGIQGVSGGPVFHCTDSGEPQIIGCVSAYFSGGQALPGLLKVQDVSQFQDTAETIRNIDEANAKKAEFDAAQKATATGQAGTAPSSPDGL
jgi:hypothetical protein